MAFEPHYSPGEKIEHDISLVISRKLQVRLVLTSHAIYWPGKKTFAVSDPITTVRITPDKIEEFYVGRKSAIGSTVAGLAMVLAGLAWTFAEYPRAYWLGYPQALIIGGVLLALYGGRRVEIRIRAGKERFRWVAPIAFGSAVKHDIAEMFKALGEWCRKHTVNVKVGSTKQVYGG